MFAGDDMVNGASHNLLRPETVEALFVLWRTTGDVRYREHGWAIFQAFQQHCKVGSRACKVQAVAEPAKLVTKLCRVREEHLASGLWNFSIA